MLAGWNSCFLAVSLGLKLTEYVPEYLWNVLYNFQLFQCQVIQEVQKGAGAS